jgi:hypothetical protein
MVTIADGVVAMPIYNKEGEIEHWCWYDIFYDAEKKKLDNPKRWFQNFYEISDEWDLPWFIMGKVYWLHDYLDWRKMPRGVSNKYTTPYKKKYILKTQYDEEGFDYDGIGDYIYTANSYREFHSLENMLESLKKNIRYENKMKPKLDTLEEFCKEFDFEVYERVY